MKYLTIFASSVFAVSLAFSGAIAADTGSQGSGGYGAGQGMGSQESQSGMTRSGAAQEVDPNQIRQVQQQLISMGFTPGNVEGELDAQTMEAIRNFQQAQGIQPTGQLNVQTLQALGVSGQEGDVQKYYGVSPEFDQSIQQPPDQGIEQPGQQMDQQQLDQRQLDRQMDPSIPQQSQPSGTMGR